MTGSDVLVVGGTHGNELNAAWLIDQWRLQPDLLEACGLKLALEIGNPEARRAGRRYIDRDLNRSFQPQLLDQPGDGLEPQRARELLNQHGPDGLQPCRVALDLHSTTAAMGTCLVVYGRRPADLARRPGCRAPWAAGVSARADAAQAGFLVERWPCGLVIEAGPVPQGVLMPGWCARRGWRYRSACGNWRQRERWGRDLISGGASPSGCRDIPRDAGEGPAALVHPQLQGQDWRPLHADDPLFERPDGEAMPLGTTGEPLFPVFINEAAYAEKRIAFSLTRREVWPIDPGWGAALAELMR